MQMHRESSYGEHLSWLHGVTRVHLKTRWTDVDCLDEPSDGDEGNEYDDNVRLGGRHIQYGPVRDRVVMILPLYTPTLNTSYV